MTRHLVRWGFSLLTLAWMSCVRPGTQVRVSVDTDLLSVLSELRVRVFRSCDDVGAALGAADGRLEQWTPTPCALPPDTRGTRAEIAGASPRSLDLVSDQTYAVQGAASCAGALRTLPIRFPVVPGSSCGDGEPYVVVEVTGRTRDGERPYQAIRQVRFQPRRARDLVVFLTDCPCGVGYSCDLGGACIPVVETEDASDAGHLDARNIGPESDAGMFDANPDGGPSCDATNCAPANACESARCVDGICQRTTRCATGETCCPSGVCALDCGTLACAGQPAGTTCRSAISPCDEPEFCDGTSPSCPPDRAVMAGTSCRAAADVCDVTETCDGTSTLCPMNAFASFGTTCAGGMCDGTGTCITGCTAGAACSTGNPCEVGEIACAPTRCVAAGPASALTVCRASVGVCDVEERCGGSTTCPPDAFAVGSVCRGVAGVCDLAETCDGTSPACPSDRFGSSVCRPAVGVCDVAESCDGLGPNCPSDAYVPIGPTLCRASTGMCDWPDYCDGTSPYCGADRSTLGYLGTAGVCRPAAGPCDTPESCDLSTVCPPNEFMPDGSDCNQACGPEFCASGFCTGGTTCIAPTPLCDCDVSCTHILSPECI